MESSTTSGSSGEEQTNHPRNSSPIHATGQLIGQKEEMDKEKWNMRTYICSLPIRADMDQYVHILEKSYKIEIQEIKTSIENTQEKRDIIDARVTNIEQELIQAKGTIQEQNKHLKQAINVIDEQENGNRRNNIRIRGLSENVNSKDLIPTLQKIFQELIQNPALNDLIIDRAHRVTGAKRPDPSKSRDVICRMNYAQTKDKIMLAARQNKNIQFEGTQLIFF